MLDAPTLPRLVIRETDIELATLDLGFAFRPLLRFERTVTQAKIAAPRSSKASVPKIIVRCETCRLTGWPVVLMMESDDAVAGKTFGWLVDAEPESPIAISISSISRVVVRSLIVSSPLPISITGATKRYPRRGIVSINFLLSLPSPRAFRNAEM